MELPTSKNDDAAQILLFWSRLVDYLLVSSAGLLP